jgi:hypothetical protein
VADTPVRAVGGQVTRVRDVAQVAWAQQEPTHLTRFNGQRGVFLTVTQKDGQDVATITKSVEKVLDDYEKTLPAGVKLQRGFVQAENVKHRLNNLFRDFGIALALVLITLLPLGPRAGLVVMVSIPLSLLIGLSMLQAFGFTLNQLSIAGFVLALGLLVDDSIVITENIARRIREGEDRTGRRQRHPPDRPGGAGLHGLPDAGLPAADGPAGRLGGLYQVAAGDGAVHHRRLAAGVDDHHPVPGQPGAGQAFGPRGQPAAAGRQRRHPSLLPAGAAPGPGAAVAGLTLMLALCLTTFPLMKLIGSSLFPGRRDAAVPGADRDARRLITGSHRPRPEICRTAPEGRAGRRVARR